MAGMLAIFVSAHDSGLSVGEWAGVASAGAAAVAAMASLITVLQNKRLISATLRPRLTSVVLAEIPEPAIQVHNAGGAVAIVVRVVWASANQRAAADLAPGIAPGQYVTALAPLPKEGIADSHGVIIYNDALQNYYANSFDGHSKVWRNRWWKRKFKKPDPRKVYADFYGTSIDDWEEVEMRVARRWADALVIEPPSTPKPSE
jgi:hypothetical protein